MGPTPEVKTKFKDFEDFNMKNLKSFKRKPPEKASKKEKKLKNLNDSGSALSSDTDMDTGESSGQSLLKNILSQNDKPAADKTEKSYNTALYPDDHDGDIFVLVDTSMSTVFQNIKLVRHGLFLYEKLKIFNFKGFLTIEMIGKTLYRIKFDSATNANFFVNSNFNDLKIKPFIPFTYIYSYGVIRGIPASFTDEAILNDIVSDVPANSVHRFTKKSLARTIKLSLNRLTR